MRSKYYVLWYEDNPEEIRDDVKPWLEQFLNGLGFELEFELFEEYHPQSAKYWQKYDLIVTDLNLVRAGVGRKLVDDIRSGHILNEVLIYSANPAALVKAVEQSPILERVSIHSGRGGLEEKLEKVVSLTVRKAQTLPHIRGQFIAEAIDLENKLLEFLGEYLAPQSCSAVAQAKKKSWEDFVKRKDHQLMKQSESIHGHDLEKAAPLLHDLKFFQSFDAYELCKDGLKAILNLSKKLGDEGDRKSEKRAVLVSEVRTKLIDFNKEVIAVRNRLAHVKEDANGERIVLKSRKSDEPETVIDDAWCVATRKSLRAHHHNLERMIELLKES